MTDRYVSLSLPESLSDQPILYELAHYLDCTFTIIEGRFDTRTARLRCRLSGPARALNHAIRFLKERGVRVTLIKPPASVKSPKPSPRRRVQSVKKSRGSARRR